MSRFSLLLTLAFFVVCFCTMVCSSLSLFCCYESVVLARSFSRCGCRYLFWVGTSSDANTVPARRERSKIVER